MNIVIKVGTIVIRLTKTLIITKRNDDGTVEKADKVSFTQAFGSSLVKLAEKHKEIAAITAAMTSGTGLEPFSRKFPERFFDVGIAEEHAVAYASAMAKPIPYAAPVTSATLPSSEN